LNVWLKYRRVTNLQKPGRPIKTAFWMWRCRKLRLGHTPKLSLFRTRN